MTLMGAVMVCVRDIEALPADRAVTDRAGLVVLPRNEKKGHCEDAKHSPDHEIQEMMQLENSG
jgi:regulator of RNase E activity RraA